MTLIEFTLSHLHLYLAQIDISYLSPPEFGGEATLIINLHLMFDILSEPPTAHPRSMSSISNSLVLTQHRYKSHASICLFLTVGIMSIIATFWLWTRKTFKL